MSLRQITASEARQLADAGGVLVDIREAAELQSGRIPGALHLPLSRLATESLPADRGGPFIFLCRSGGRTAAYAPQLEAKVPAGAKAFLLEGGIEAWGRDGQQIVRG